MEKEGKGTSFFKNFGMGLVYTVLFPLIVAASLVYGLIALVRLILEVFPRLIRFFKGEEFFSTLREDKEVALVMKTQHERMLNGIPSGEGSVPTQQPPTAVYVQNNYYTQSPLPNAPQAQSLTPMGSQPFPQYIDGTGSYLQNQTPAQNPANPSLIQQNPAQISNNMYQQVDPTLVAIPTYKPAPEKKETIIDPLGDNDDDAA